VRLAAFLKENSLTTTGLREFLGNFLIALDENGSWVGVAGYEPYGKNALLRSVAVDKGSRNRGHGRTLVEAALAEAKKQGIRTIYLFTETAEAYFKRLGFEPVDRNSVEQAVKNSAELTECCKTAQPMRKSI